MVDGKVKATRLNYKVQFDIEDLDRAIEEAKSKPWLGRKDRNGRV